MSAVSAAIFGIILFDCVTIRSSQGRYEIVASKFRKTSFVRKVPVVQRTRLETSAALLDLVSLERSKKKPIPAKIVCASTETL